MSFYFLITNRTALYLVAFLVGSGWIVNLVRRKRWNWPRFFAASTGGAIGYLMVPLSGVSPMLEYQVAYEFAYSEPFFRTANPQEFAMIMLQSASGILLGTFAAILLQLLKLRHDIRPSRGDGR